MSLLRQFICWFFGHVPRVSYWSTPINGYRCARCKAMVAFEHEVDEP